MAIQLPEVKRIEPDAPVSVGRIQANVPDPRADLASEQSGINNLAEQGIKYRNQVADQTADTIATDAANKFAQRWKTEMYGDPETGKVGAKYMQGNPTDTFKQFDATMQGHLNDLSSSSGDNDWSQETQNLVNRRLGKKAQELQMRTLTEYGAQQNKYDDNVTETAVKMNADAMPSATATIDPQSVATGDKSTLQPIQEKISNIQNARIAQALRLGGATLDPNGQSAYTDAGGQEHRVTIGPVTQQKIKEDLSKALHDSTDNLIKTGAEDPQILAKAKVMMNEFGNYIEPLKQGGIQAEFNKAQVKNEAYQLAGDGGHMSPDQFEKTLDGHSYEVQTEARKIKSDNSRYMEADRRNQQELNYRTAYQQAVQFKQANPAATETQLEQQPFFKNFESKMDPKDVRAIKEVVEPPKVSDQNAVVRVNAILRGDVQGMDPTQMTGDQWNKEFSGLNETDRTAFAREAAKASGPENMTKQFSANTRAITELKSQAVRSGLVSYDARDGSQKFDPGGNNDKTFGAMQYAFTQKLQQINAGGNLNPAEMKDEAAKFLTDWKSNTPYEPPVKKFKASGPAFGTAQPAVPTKVPRTQVQINGSAIKDYTNQNGRAPNAKELKDYIANDKSGRYNP
jgi:hypothetical protein